MTETLHKAAHSTLAFHCLQRKSKVKHKFCLVDSLLILIIVKSNTEGIRNAGCSTYLQYQSITYYTITPL